MGGWLLISCSQDDVVPQTLTIQDIMVIPLGLPTVTTPEDNGLTVERWLLGKKLFFDPRMSSDHTISCASCHQPSLAFGDDLPHSPGVEGRPGTRNSPSLANVAYHPYFTREGGVPTLEMQVLVPIQEHNEFDHNIVLLAEQLSQDQHYTSMAMTAYQRPIDPFVITRALAAFERTLISGNSRYDRYEFQGDEAAFSQEEIEGKNLFFGDRTNCSKCHSGFNFTNYAFENNGLYEVYEDAGRMRLTGEEEDRARFKVPSLRNVALTSPYMHDGSVSSLAEVVAHYSSGGKGHPHQSQHIAPLSLTPTEKSALVAFLQSLTDSSFITNPIFQE